MGVLKAAVILTGCCVACALGQCFGDVDRVPTRQALLSGMDDFFAASNRFGIRLLHALNTSSVGTDDEGTFFSPFSVWSSMILLYLGSRGTTERELEALLGLQGMEKNLVAHSYLSLKFWFTSRRIRSCLLWFLDDNLAYVDFGQNPELARLGINYLVNNFLQRIRTSAHTSFTMVNNLFLQKDVRIRSCLLRFLDDNLAYVDFGQNPELARLGINYLVSRETQSRIAEILPPFSVHSLTRFVVTSTMYFKGAWAQQFPPHATRPRPFFDSHLGQYVPVDTMAARDVFLYATSDQLQCSAVELPYVGRSLTMVVMLPNNKAHGVQILTSSLTEERLHDLMEDMFPREVLVLMPKFQLEDSFQLSSTLLKMGFRDLSSSSLNLTGFTDDVTLGINAVYHKAHVAVDEKGTEATAGTASAVSRSSRPTRTVEFVVDRPFVFYIRENHSGSILFMGIVRKPGHSNLSAP